MSTLSFIEKQTAYRLFGISDGFAFKYWTEQGQHNKTTTKDIILDACGINIFDDEGFKNLSQQKCIQKIWDEGSPSTVAKLLRAFCDYFSFKMGTDYWSDEDNYDYHQIEQVIERLQSESSVELPANDSNNTDLQLILDDIDANIKQGRPEMVVDRLHTFSSSFIRTLCQKHGLSTADSQGHEYAIHSLIGILKNWYASNNYFESDFAVVAIQNSINVFERFNAIRNDHSAAHPNAILNKTEAMYAVRIISETLKFMDAIERIKDKEEAERQRSKLPWEDNDFELPF